MAIKELVENYESGRIVVRGKEKTAKRVVIASTFPSDDDLDTWLTSEGIPAYGDAWSVGSDLRVNLIEIEGTGSLNSELVGIHKYTRAKVTINYSTNQAYEVTLSRKELAGELLEVGGFGSFETSGNPIERPMCIPIGLGSIIIPRQYYPEPTSTIIALLNKVNNSTWTHDGYGYPAETVFFAGYSSILTWVPGVGPQYNIEYHFKINMQGWNKAFDGKASALAGYAIWDNALPKRFTPASFTGFPP